MRKVFSIVLLCSLLASSGCGKRQTASSVPVTADSIRYAQGFSITRYDQYIKVELRDPWDTTRLLHRYLLVSRDRDMPKELPEGTVIRVPMQNIVVYTSTHAAIIDQLGETNTIIGVCEPRYMDLPAIQEGINNGRIIDMGESTSPNVEAMIAHAAEVVIASPFQNGSYGPVEKMGIPIVESADYMESTPLGRAEWIKFYALLFDKEQMGDSLFRVTEQHYLQLKSLVATSKSRPTVFAEKRFGQVWYVAGGESYMARFFKDAGADYMFSDVKAAGSQPMQYEAVYEKAVHADYWLLKYNQETAPTYRDLESEYKPYANFDAFAKRHIFVCNTMYNHYYEEFPTHPDRLLQDLILIFHPELLPKLSPLYYQPMAD